MLPAGSITTSVSNWTVPPVNTWTTSPGSVPRGWPFGWPPAISTTPRPRKLATQTSSLPSIDTPHGTLITGLRAFSPDHVDPSRGISRCERLHQVLASELKLLHDRHAVVQGHI